MKEWKTTRIIGFVCFCIVINMAGKQIADSFRLPLGGDCIGTMLCAYVGGPICGGIVGAGTCFVCGAYMEGASYYFLSHLLFGVLVGIFAKKGMLSSAFSAFSLGMIAAIICTVLSVPVHVLVLDGFTGNMWGDGVVSFLQEQGLWSGLCYVLGAFGVELLDKQVLAIGSFFIIRVSQKRKKENKDIAKKTGMLLSVLFLAFFGTQNEVNAAQISSDYDNYIQTIYNNENGIPGSEVNDIAQTTDGTLWIGTYSGLYQYDGNEFTFMSEFDSVRNANCLYTDEQDRVWVGTNDSGLSICANGEIVTVLDKAGGLPEDSVRSIIKSADGHYYVGTTGAMCSLALTDGIEVRRVFEELQYVWNLTANKEGYVCAVTSEGELALVYEDRIVCKMDKNARGERFSSAYFGPDEILYVATANQNIEKYVISENRFIKVSTIACKALRCVRAMYWNEKEQLFLCADNGIGYLDASGSVYVIPTGDFTSSIEHVLVDYQGNYWFSSTRLGLLKLSESVTKNLYKKMAMDEKVVNAVTKWKNTYYFATDHGLDVATGNLEKAIHNSISEIFDDIRIRCVMVDDANNLWVATYGKGLYVFCDDGRQKRFTSKEGMLSENTREVRQLADGSYAIATDAGVNLFDGRKMSHAIGKKEGMAIPKTLCLCELNGMLYVGTDGGGIAVIKDGEIKKQFRRQDGLSSDVILRLVPSSDQKGLFVVASNGLNYLNENGEILQINEFPYYNNFDMIKVDENTFWVTCSAGIYIVDEASLTDAFSVEYELLDVKKGFFANLTANSWNYLDENGMLFLCADSGVVAVDTKRYDRKKESYRLGLDYILADGKRMAVDKEEGNVIARNAKRIDFYPKIINFSTSDPYVQIWLEGFDTEKTVMLQSELEGISYTNIPCGEYVFHIAILDNKKKDIIEEVSYLVIKEKEIYDNWWFILYMIVLASIVVLYFTWLLIGSQISQGIKLQKQELENMKLKQKADAAMAAGQAKDRFLALMSHDIRTPINTILGMNEMILRESNQKNILGYSQDIQRASSILLSLVNSILDFSKIEEGKMEIVPAEYVTRDMIVSLIRGIQIRANEKDLDFKLKVDETIPSRLYGDDIRVSQVISNLLTNAVKYTNRGFVSLVIRVHEKKGDSVTLYVEVKDSGIGIKPENMEKMFESFQRLDQQKNRTIEGTGLGMPIVSKLLELMDSRLMVESTYGEGSKFCFFIEQRVVLDEPMGEIGLRTQPEEKKNLQAHLQAPKAQILVVDDNMMNLKVAKGLLKINGIVPDIAMSGKEAIACIEKKKYHIVLLDHMMPEMDGVQTLEKIKKEKLVDDETKIIVLTANAINGAREQYLAMGFDDYLSKPIEITLLESKLSKYLPEAVLKNDMYLGAYDESAKEPLLDKQKEENVMHAAKEMPFNLQCETAKNDTLHNPQAAADPMMQRLLLTCEQIDIVTGLKYCMESTDFYLEVLEEYVHGNKADLLGAYFQDKDFANYRVLIHSVKSNSLSIGASLVAEKAKELELAAKEGDVAYIEEHHDAFMKMYQKLLADLNRFFDSSAQEV